MRLKSTAKIFRTRIYNFPCPFMLSLLYTVYSSFQTTVVLIWPSDHRSSKRDVHKCQIMLWRSILGVKAIVRSSSSFSTKKANPHLKGTGNLYYWLDVGVIHRRGKSYNGEFESTTLCDRKSAEYFPSVKCYNLNNKEVTFPHDIKGVAAKLVCIAFQDAGFIFLRDWLNPFFEKFSTELGNKTVAAVELNFVEFGFLAFARSSFISNLKKQLPPDRAEYTGVTFGGTKDLANELLLPHKYTCYVYLLDSQNRVRWRNTGTPSEMELEALFRCTQEVVDEEAGTVAATAAAATVR